MQWKHYLPTVFMNTFHDKSMNLKEILVLSKGFGVGARRYGNL